MSFLGSVANLAPKRRASSNSASLRPGSLGPVVAVQGIETIAKKVGEEGVEVAVSATSRNGRLRHSLLNGRPQVLEIVGETAGFQARYT